MKALSDQEHAEVETLLRQRLGELADHAPSTVHLPDEVSVVTAQQPARRGRRVGIIAAVTALIGAGGFTTYSFLGTSNNGGAATPEEAVTAFVSAAEHEDVLGMIDVTLPEEVAVLHAAIDSVVEDAKRIDVLDAGFNSSGVQGIDISVNDLALETNFYEGGLASVRATNGTLGLSFDPQAFPFGQKLRSALTDPLVDPLSSSTASLQLGTGDPIAQLMTVERDGRWYVSVEYTIAEYVRLATGWEVPGPVVRAPVGFDSAEEAVTGFYQRLATLDIQSAFDTFAPGEDAVAWLAQSWVANAQSAIDEGRAKGWSVQVSGLTYETIGTGDNLTLEPVTFRVEGTSAADLKTESGAQQSTEEPQPFTIERADGCTTYTGFARDLAGAAVFGAASQSPMADSVRQCGPASGFGALGLLFLSGGNSDLPSVSVVRTGGKWYVSPLGTALSSLSTSMHDLDPGASLLDSPFAVFIYGVPSRAFLESIATGQDVESLDPQCLPALTVEGGKVTGVAADPPPAATRACMSGSWSASSSSGVEELSPEPKTVPPATTP